MTSVMTGLMFLKYCLLRNTKVVLISFQRSCFVPLLSVFFPEGLLFLLHFVFVENDRKCQNLMDLKLLVRL